jgi:aryl-alcohol dehydrogenase-like predicted oxidoreductase
MRYLEGVPSAKRLSRIGLGTWQFGSREWGYGDEYDGKEAGRIVARAVELGVTVVDTAEAYGFGESERIVGAALKDHDLREQVYVATKIFPVFPIAPVVVNRGKASAGRLGVDTIDLYQVHQPNPVIKDGQTMPGMRQLQQEGVVRDVGVSNYSLARWKQAERELGSPVLSNQVEMSLAAMDALDDLVPYAASVGRVVIAWSPLGQGFLSGRYSVDNPPPAGVRSMNPLFLPESFERGAALLGTLREVAANHDISMSQASLAWLLHQPNVVAIPGASSVEQLEKNVAAAEVDLADDEAAALTAAARAFHRPPRTAAIKASVSRRLHR